MKKLMIGLVGACAFGVMAEVASENVVGYTTKDVAAGEFAMIGVQFTDIGESSTLSIQEFIKGAAEGSIYDDFTTTASQIQVWNGSTYDFYFCLSDAWIDDGTEDGQYKPGWSDPDGIFSDATFTPGSAVWFKAVDDCTITTAGQVYNASQTSVTCAGGEFSMVANSKPVALNLNDSAQVSYSDLIGGSIYDDFTATAPQIQVWNGTTYDFYFYLEDAWIDDGTEDGQYAPGWANPDGIYVDTATIPAGVAFWVKALTGTFTFTFAK